MGLMSARKLMKNRKKHRWSQKAHKKRTLGMQKKVDPLEGAFQAKGIVISKFQKEARQPKQTDQVEGSGCGVCLPCLHVCKP